MISISATFSPDNGEGTSNLNGFQSQFQNIAKINEDQKSIVQNQAANQITQDTNQQFELARPTQVRIVDTQIWEVENEEGERRTISSQSLFACYFSIFHPLKITAHHFAHLPDFGINIDNIIFLTIL